MSTRGELSKFIVELLRPPGKASFEVGRSKLRTTTQMLFESGTKELNLLNLSESDVWTKLSLPMRRCPRKFRRGIEVFIFSRMINWAPKHVKWQTDLRAD